MKLFDNIEIGSITAKNRLIMPAINLKYCPGGEASDRLINFYERRAKGGVGTIVVGGCLIAEPNYSSMVSISDDQYISGLHRLTKRLHGYEVKVFAQLFHAGRYASSKATGCQAVAPSPIASRYTRETPRELTIAEIEIIVEQFANAAYRAQEAGFDGIELIGSAGYLISQFFSPITNKRNDKYGGSFANRIRFSLELVNQISKVVGSQFPLIFRVSGNEFMPGGNTNKEVADKCIELEKAGVDLFNVTGGWHESIIPQITMQVPRAAMAHLAMGIKNSVNVPVVACNRITDPFTAEKIVSNGQADMVGLGRVLIADPDWPNKAAQGRGHEIRYCVACNQGCLDNIFSGKEVECTVNAEAGYEEVRKIEPTSKPAKVLVVGSGPSGLECGRVLAQRGHQVEIWEEKNTLGGQLNLVSSIPGFEEWNNLKHSLISAIERSNVKVIINQKATLNAIVNHNPDVVVIASGAESIIPQIAGIEYTFQASEILEGNVSAGKNVIIIGAGAVGCKTALFLTEQNRVSSDILAFFIRYQGLHDPDLEELLPGSKRKITLIEKTAGIGGSIGQTTRWIILQDLKQAQVDYVTNATVTEIRKDGVEYKQGQNSYFINADTVIIASGLKSKDDLSKDLKKVIPHVFTIGDSKQPRNILEAIHEGYIMGSEI